jgi:hypothetical protein
MGFLGGINMDSKWDVKKKNDKYWQISQTPDPDVTWTSAFILFFILLIIKFPDKVINLFK